jgi:hypothetical protein
MIFRFAALVTIEDAADLRLNSHGPTTCGSSLRLHPLRIDNCLQQSPCICSCIGFLRPNENVGNFPEADFWFFETLLDRRRCIQTWHYAWRIQEIGSRGCGDQGWSKFSYQKSPSGVAGCAGRDAVPRDPSVTRNPTLALRHKRFRLWITT